MLLVTGGVIIFLNRKPFSEARVEFKIEGPSEISSGELVAYKISYVNNNKAALADAKLTFFYPTDAVAVRDGNVSNVTNEIIDVGIIAAGGAGEKTLSAYLVGDRGNIKIAKASLAFGPANVRATVKIQATMSSTITALPVALTLVAPPSVIGGQNTTYLIDYRNQSPQDFSNLRFKIKYPDGFTFASAAPSPTDGQNVWDIARLKQGEGSRITIQGALRGSEREAKLVALVLQKKITTPGGDTYVDFEKTEAGSVISSPFLTLNLKVNDSANYTAHLGDDLRYSIVFRNNSDVDIGGLNLSVKLDGGMFDFSAVRSDAFFDGRANTITWNSSVAPGLALLRPGQSSEAKFSVKLKSGVSGAGGAASSLVKASAHLETFNVPASLDADRLVADGEIITRISSAPSFDQKILLNDSEFGGDGPFPPQVNKKTVFTIRWILTNPSSDLTPAKVTAVLAPGAKWEARARVNGSQPLPSYDLKTNSVTWDLGTLPGGAGAGYPRYETNFQISITPSSNQVDQPAPLLKNGRFDGTDVFTKEKISRTVQDSTTFNVEDSQESGNVKP